MALVDVHTHLTHEKFSGEVCEVIKRAEQAGLKAIIVNGLNPASNRQVLQMAKDYKVVKPALGIYPLDAANGLHKDLPFEIPQFDVDKELSFIEQEAKKGTLFALGECGLDGYYGAPETFSEQERVFERFIELSLTYKLPLIIHTRKREVRTKEILVHHNVKDVNFHCYGGRTKHAINWAETYGWYFSIPANGRRNQAFSKLLRSLRPDRLLTETDAPYLPPNPGTRNEPKNVKTTIELLGELRGWGFEKAKEVVWENYLRLFHREKGPLKT